MKFVVCELVSLINRPGVAGIILIDWLIKSVILFEDIVNKTSLPTRKS